MSKPTADQVRIAKAIETVLVDNGITLSASYDGQLAFRKLGENTYTRFDIDTRSRKGANFWEQPESVEHLKVTIDTFEDTGLHDD